MRKILRPLIVALLSLLTIPAFAQGAHVPVYRGYAASTAVAASIQMSFPTSSQAGDLGVLFFSSGYTSPPPTGWTPIYQSGPALWAATAAYRYLTSDDISARKVTINVANEGVFDLHAGLVVYQGSTVDGILEVQDFNSASGGYDYLNSSPNPLKGDVILFWSSDREGQPAGPTEPYIWDGQGNPINGTPNVFSTSMETANAWSVFEWQPMQAGSFSTGYYFAPPGGGNGQLGVQVVVKCHAVAGTCFVN